MLGFFSEDQPYEHVQASEGEKEESSHEGEVVYVVREDGGAEEALKDSEGTKPEVLSEDGEVCIEEFGGPADFGEYENDDLQDDQHPVDHSPENTCGLIGYCAVSEKVYAS